MPTLRDVLDRVRTDTTLPATRRRDMASALRTLARVLDAHEVDDVVADRYLALLQDESIVKNPRRVHQTACHCWNIARARVQAWPRQVLTVSHYRDTYGLPWPVFPDGLREDVDRWLAMLSGDDLFATDGPAKPLKPSR